MRKWSGIPKYSGSAPCRLLLCMDWNLFKTAVMSVDSAVCINKFLEKTTNNSELILQTTQKKNFTTQSLLLYGYGAVKELNKSSHFSLIVVFFSRLFLLKFLRNNMSDLTASNSLNWDMTELYLSPLLETKNEQYWNHNFTSTGATKLRFLIRFS